MKQVMKSLVVVGAMLAAGTAAAEMMADVKPVVGVDYYQVWMKGQNSVTLNNVKFNGSDILPKSFPGATIYVGAKFMENFGAELGYDWSSSKKTSYVSGSGATAVTIKDTVKRSGFHLDLVGYLPVNDCSNVFASLGMGWVKAKLTDVTRAVGTAAAVAVPTSSKTKSVLRLGIGANYMFTDMFGARVKVGYEGTKALRHNINNTGDAKYFKDSTTLAAGLFAQF